MAYRFDDFRQFGKEHIEVMTASSSSLAKCWQTIPAESSEDFKKSLAAKSFGSAIHIQSEYPKTFFEGLVGYVTKTGELYSNFAKEAFKPIESAVTKVKAPKE